MSMLVGITFSFKIAKIHVIYDVYYLRCAKMNPTSPKHATFVCCWFSWFGLAPGLDEIAMGYVNSIIAYTATLRGTCD